MNWLTMNLDEIAKRDFICDCSRRHYTGIETILVEKGAIAKVTGVVSQQRKKDGVLLNKKHDTILLVEDVHTRPLAGNRIAEDLIEAGYIVDRCYFSQEELVASDEAVTVVREMITDKTALLIAVGSGTLNDITKYSAFQTELPFYIFGTAPSMDGYASPVAPLIINGLKYAKDAIGPTAIIADIDIVKDAPLRMMAAGFGDLVGKCVSICDWKISNIVNGEEYCQQIADTVLGAVKICTDNVDKLFERDETAVKNVMDALILCGLMMNYAKTSRPASGSEHGLDHFWELMQLFQHMPVSMHGEGVGVGSVASCVILRKLLDKTPDKQIAVAHLEGWDRKLWEDEIRSFCVRGADDVLSMEDDFKKNQAETVLPRLEQTIAHWDEIQEVISTYIPHPDTMRNALKAAHAPSCPAELGLNEQHLINALRYAKDTRYRYSVLQLIWDLGIENECIDAVRAYFGYCV